MDTQKVKERIVAKKICRAFFKNGRGQPMEITDGQADLFNLVFLRRYRRQQSIGPTQYGKSETLAMALDISAAVFGMKWWILTGQQTKSDVIMGKCIDHLFDNNDLLSELEIDHATPLERLKRERSKEKLTFKGGGEIRTITADARNRKRVYDSLSGLGNENILEDEAPLIQDDLQAMVLRMLGGHGGGYLIKVGNPYNRGHFYKTWNDPKYHKIFIDYQQALKEGRYTREFIEEMRQEPFFEILYECKFPDESAQDEDGWYRLLTDAELEAAFQEAWKEDGVMRLGYDPGEGGDESAGVRRNDACAQTVYAEKLRDPMDNVVKVKNLMTEHKVKPGNTFWDANGIGSGGHSRLKEQGLNIVAVRWGESAYDKKTFANNKAEQYWKLRVWVKNGGKICDRHLLDELRVIKYKEDSGGQTKIIGKEELRKKGIKSPNRADAFAMTFDKNLDEKAPQIIV